MFATTRYSQHSRVISTGDLFSQCIRITRTCKKWVGLTAAQEHRTVIQHLNDISLHTCDDHTSMASHTCFHMTGSYHHNTIDHMRKIYVIHFDDHLHLSAALVMPT